MARPLTSESGSRVLFVVHLAPVSGAKCTTEVSFSSKAPMQSVRGGEEVGNGVAARGGLVV